MAPHCRPMTDRRSQLGSNTDVGLNPARYAPGRQDSREGGGTALGRWIAPRWMFKAHAMIRPTSWSSRVGDPRGQQLQLGRRPPCRPPTMTSLATRCDGLEQPGTAPRHGNRSHAPHGPGPGLAFRLAVARRHTVFTRVHPDTATSGSCSVPTTSSGASPARYGPRPARRRRLWEGVPPRPVAPSPGSGLGILRWVVDRTITHRNVANACVRTSERRLDSGQMTSCRTAAPAAAARTASVQKAVRHQRARRALRALLRRM